jgi:protein-S-isoprenylcysteine O-methyltransferase Ste14
VRSMILAQPLRRARLYDLAAASPLIILLVFAIAGFSLKIQNEIARYPPSSALALSVATKTAGAIFAAAQVAFFIIRRLPIAKFAAWWPRIIALIGGNSTLLFLMLPAAAPRVQTDLISSVILMVGTGGSILALIYLGRSFSVTPQARAIVVSGPYRFIRHPLFLCEQIISFGIMFQYEQPWAFLVFSIGVAAQFPRMYFEELILSQTFPAYRLYAERTAKLIPGLS